MEEESSPWPIEGSAFQEIVLTALVSQHSGNPLPTMTDRQDEALAIEVL